MKSRAWAYLPARALKFDYIQAYDLIAYSKANYAVIL